MALEIGRRRFLELLSATAAMWPLPAQAQQTRRVHRVGVLMGLANDAEAQARAKVFEQGLEKLGWALGRNLRVDYRFAAGDPGRMRTFADELVNIQPDVIVGHSTPVVAALTQTTKSIPVVFVVVSDPIGSGFVASMARPGGNITGFTNLQATITGKHLSILNEIIPGLTHVALMYDPTSATQAGAYYMDAFLESATEFKVTPILAKVHNPRDLETVMAELGGHAGSGLVVMPDNFTAVHRKLIVSLAAQFRIPTVYPYRYFADGGGLLSYGVDVMDLFRRAAEYVDRILLGANPADLPVQAPTKFELVINLRTAKALGVTIPKILLAGADALIE